MDCIFCKIVNGEIPSYTIYEDDIVKVFLDINPQTNGDTLIIPKKHFNNILDIDINTCNHINEVIKKMYPLLKEKLHCEGMTIIQNNDLGQDIKHFHVHLTPRYTNDLLNHTYNKDTIKNIEEIYAMIKGE